MKKNLERKVRNAVIKCPLSMAQAAKYAGIPYSTFIRHAKVLGVYSPNQSGKGCNKTSGNKIPLDDILSGKHPQYQTNKLRIRLLNEGLKENICECCGISNWNEKDITIELDHKDGDCLNHRFENLQMLCPNCHSQTSTFRGRNKRNARVVERYTQQTF